ncbi:MAG: hypothetical protein E2594_06845 [Pseudomonas sp.]|uniref:hypothetical protein n=1 Tax=Pseudomonadaceae TaxID=135621 RepID=UPI00117B05EA|nr:hypothetical protein [Pseudomonas putida]MPS56868.1 hypothetical protein [Pseudomonas sp.]TRO36405.1 hypothetical protein EQ845_10885 [Pseudomonas putida]
MSRQRTINDSVFWRSPKMAGRTQEDRATLTYLLTCPFSNIIGAYQIVPRIAASEMGWDTESQFMPILRRLQEAGFIEYEAETSFVWVHIWWDHNYPLMALAPKLRQKTFSQIQALPEKWRPLYIEDLLERLPRNEELRNLLANTFGLSPDSMRNPPDGVSIPYAYPIDRVRVNSNYKSNSNPTTLDLEPLKQLSTGEREKIIALLRDVTDADARSLLAELSKAMARPGHITQSPIQYFHGLLQRHRSGDFVPTTPGAKAAAELALDELKALVARPGT